jgi:hypothetical protein
MPPGRFLEVSQYLPTRSSAFCNLPRHSKITRKSHPDNCSNVRFSPESGRLFDSSYQTTTLFSDLRRRCEPIASLGDAYRSVPPIRCSRHCDCIARS